MLLMPVTSVSDNNPADSSGVEVVVKGLPPYWRPAVAELMTRPARVSAEDPETSAAAAPTTLRR